MFCELDYGFREARRILKRASARLPRHHGAHRPLEVRLVAGFPAEAVRPRRTIPKELRDLGADGAYAPIRREMEERMAAWLKARKTRVTVDDAYVEARTATHKKHGIFFGVWWRGGGARP